MADLALRHEPQRARLNVSDAVADTWLERRLARDEDEGGDGYGSTAAASVGRPVGERSRSLDPVGGRAERFCMQRPDGGSARALSGVHGSDARRWGRRDHVCQRAQNVFAVCWTHGETVRGLQARVYGPLVHLPVVF